MHRGEGGTGVEKTRNDGIEALRLLFMFMVCLLHILGQGGVLAACQPGTAAYGLFWLMEAVGYCAVDGFAFISGYTAKNRPQQWEKIVDMWFQEWFYSLVLSLLLGAAGVGSAPGLTELLHYCFPVTFHVFWYFTAYVALFFAAPVLNAFLFRVAEAAAKRAFLLLVGLFSVLGTVADPFHTKGGYSALWLMAVYCMGALARRIRLFEGKKSGVLVLMWLGCSLITWAGYVFGGMGRWMSYLSPTVLMSAMVLVVLFSRLPVKGNLVRKVTPAVFGIYLFQVNPVVWSGLLYNACGFVVSEPLPIGAACVLGAAGVLFAVGFAVETVRLKLAQWLCLNAASQKAVAVLDGMLGRLAVLLR